MTLQDAPLATDEGEVGVGCEDEAGLGVVIQVVGDVPHARLLLRSDDRAQGEGQPPTRALDLASKEVGGIE